MSRRTQLIVLGVVGAAAILVIGYNLLSGPPRARASDEALKAAKEIVQAQGGGEQVKTEDGVPLDAAVKPGSGNGGKFTKP